MAVADFKFGEGPINYRLPQLRSHYPQSNEFSPLLNVKRLDHQSIRVCFLFEGYEQLDEVEKGHRTSFCDSSVHPFCAK